MRVRTELSRIGWVVVPRPTRSASALGSLALVFAAALAVAGSALASGATTIAAAPLVTPGVTVDANSSTDATAVGDDGVGFESGCWDAVEYWKLALTAGDQVKISAKVGVGTTNLEVAVFPAGTTGANLGNAKSVKTGFASVVPIEFTAPKTGSYPLAAGPNCYDGANGPFSFVVTVTHHPVKSSARRSR